MRNGTKKNQAYEVMGMSIIIPLNYKGYKVRANILKDRENLDYTVTYEMTLEGYPFYSCIEGDIFTLNTEKGVNYEVYRFTMNKFASGYFKPFIDRFDTEMTAMNIGFNCLESENYDV